MPDRSGPRGAARGAGVLGGALLGLGAGVLGTAVHLTLSPLPGGWTLPWGAVLALVLAGSVQRWWMRRAAERGGAPLPAGAAVVAGAFTAVLALHRLPVHDALGVPWTAGMLAAAPGAVVASVAWTVGQPLLGLVLLAAGRRLDRRPAEAADGATRPRRATVTARETRPGERVPWTAAPQPRAQREVDGQP